MSSRTVYATLPDSVFAEHQQKVCEHSRKAEVSTYDGTTLETVCLDCGKTFPSQETPLDKLDRAFDLEEFRKVRYGPATPVPLQSFMLPTIAHGVKCRDKFVDTNHLNMTRKYTDLQRICQRLNIPNDYAVEVMKELLKQKKGLFSKHRHIEILQGLLEKEPRLHNRIPKLQGMTRQAEQIAMYRRQIKELRKQLYQKRS